MKHDRVSIMVGSCCAPPEPGHLMMTKCTKKQTINKILQDIVQCCANAPNGRGSEIFSVLMCFSNHT